MVVTSAVMCVNKFDKLGEGLWSVLVSISVLWSTLSMSGKAAA